MKAFEDKHPYRLTDGRRFASLFCAEDTITAVRGVDNKNALLPVVDTATGEAFNREQTKAAVNPYSLRFKH